LIGSGFTPTQYPKRSDGVSLGIAASHIAFVLTPIYLAAAVQSVPLLICLWLWFGVSMNGLLNLMHECAHYHVFNARRGSDLLGRWILAPLMATDFDGYRALHWAHHRDLGGAGDPKYSYSVDVRRWRLALFVASCLVGMEAFRKFFYQQQYREGMSGSRSWRWILRVVVVHGVLFISLVGTASWMGATDARVALARGMVAYAFVYLYGLIALTLLFATLRAIAEHQAGPDGPITAGRAALRNLRCGPVGRMIFGSYGFAEHATHHWQPAIPYYHLQKATDTLAAGDTHFAPRRGYWVTLTAQVVQLSSPPQTIPPPQPAHSRPT
jgi:fatty acid desaturase